VMRFHKGLRIASLHIVMIVADGDGSEERCILIAATGIFSSTCLLALTLQNLQAPHELRQ